MLTLHICILLFPNILARTISTPNLAIPHEHTNFKERIVPQFVSPYPEKIIQGYATYLKLDCQLKKISPRFSVKWYRGGSPLVINEPRFKIVDSGFSLVIENSKIVDSDNYACEIFMNEAKSLTKQFEVKVVHQPISAPIVRKNLPGNFTILRGSDLTIECEVMNLDGAGFWEVLWLKHHPNAVNRMKDENGNLLYKVMKDCANSGTCIDIENEISGRNSYTLPADEVLRLHLKKISESGWYSCVTRNEFGTDISSGYIEVVNELNKTASFKEEVQGPNVLLASTGTISVMAVVLIPVFIYFIYKYNRKARLEKQLRSETNKRANKIMFMAKQVLVELKGDDSQGGDEESKALFPHVTIRNEPKPFPQSADQETDTTINCQYIFQTDPEWEFDRNKLMFKGLLGEGAFGLVKLAEVQSHEDSRMPSLVAVKMLKENHTDKDIIDFVSEIEVMKIIGSHENIINLLGICTSPPGEPLCAIVEYARCGNLKDYLVAHRPKCNKLSNQGLYMVPVSENDEETQLKLSDQLNMAWQVAKGMQFLALRRYVHRDLAARNVLVCDNQVYKIADFGMTRDIHDNEYYRKLTSGRVPLKWMAPEAICDQIYTTQSDVWSYGILLWEIMTFGENPFQNTSPNIFPELLLYGKRLDQPKGCPLEVYTLMLETWKTDPCQRPSWSQIVERTHRLLAEYQPNEYLILSSKQDYEDYLPPSLLTPPPTPAEFDTLQKSTNYDKNFP